MSLPMRGEWIEINALTFMSNKYKSLPMRGEWIEIFLLRQAAPNQYSLSPCGESGLKFYDLR